MNYGERGWGGGLQVQYDRGGQVKFYPHERGNRKSLSHAEEGPKSFWVVLTRKHGGGGLECFTVS